VFLGSLNLLWIHFSLNDSGIGRPHVEDLSIRFISFGSPFQSGQQLPCLFSCRNLAVQSLWNPFWSEPQPWVVSWTSQGCFNLLWKSISNLNPLHQMGFPYPVFQSPLESISSLNMELWIGTWNAVAISISFGDPISIWTWYWLLLVERSKFQSPLKSISIWTSLLKHHRKLFPISFGDPFQSWTTIHIQPLWHNHSYVSNLWRSISRIWTLYFQLFISNLSVSISFGHFDLNSASALVVQGNFLFCTQSPLEIHSDLNINQSVLGAISMFQSPLESISIWTSKSNTFQNQ